MNPFSIKLRKILLSNFFYITLGLWAIISVIISYLIPPSIPKVSNKITYQGRIISKQQNDTTLIIQTKGSISFQIILKTNSKESLNFAKSIHLGSIISFQGESSRIKDSTYLFSKKSYARKLAHQKIYYVVKPSQIRKENNFSIYTIQEKLDAYLDSFKSRAYLKTFLLGDSTYISKELKNIYQTLGISHLFALSGMHISFLAGGIYNFLKRKKKSQKVCCYISFGFLILYCLLVKQSPSILRASAFFIAFKLNNLYDLHIAPYQLLLLLLSCFLIFNPYLIEEASFLYSFIISSSLVLFNKKLLCKTKFLTLLKTSSISFFASLPITIYFQYQANFLSIFWNLFFIPFVSIILFPLSFIVALCPLFEPIFLFLLFILEKLSKICFTCSFLTFPFMKLSCFYYIILFIIYILSYFKPKIIFIYIFLLILHTFIFPFFKPDRLTMLDVGQGDSFLFESKGQALLLDTGGKEGSNRQDASLLVKELMARGIKKIRVILSHGDLDHAGNLKDLIKTYPISSIGFNLGFYNQTEKEIIKEAKEKNIPYQKIKEGMSFEVGNFNFLQLNKAYQDENESSAIYFVTWQDKTMLFLGDATLEVEEKILDTYEIPDLTFLKIAHHGSKTSSSEKLLSNRIIRYALISSGRNNFYNHPSSIVLSRLLKYKIPIYNTKNVGSVQINFSKGTIKTCLSLKKNT